MIKSFICTYNFNKKNAITKGVTDAINLIKDQKICEEDQNGEKYRLGIKIIGIKPKCLYTIENEAGVKLIFDSYDGSYLPFDIYTFDVCPSNPKVEVCAELHLCDTRLFYGSYSFTRNSREINYDEKIDKFVHRYYKCPCNLCKNEKSYRSEDLLTHINDRWHNVVEERTHKHIASFIIPNHNNEKYEMINHDIREIDVFSNMIIGYNSIQSLDIRTMRKKYIKHKIFEVLYNDKNNIKALATIPQDMEPLKDFIETMGYTSDLNKQMISLAKNIILDMLYERVYGKFIWADF